MPRKESANEAYLRKRVNETRGFVRKVKWPGVRGAPDDLVMWPHLKTYSFVELKEERSSSRTRRARSIGCAAPA
jgi:hypothetical protein